MHTMRGHFVHEEKQSYQMNFKGFTFTWRNLFEFIPLKVQGAIACKIILSQHSSYSLT